MATPALASVSDDLRQLGSSTSPLTLAKDQLLPVGDALAGLLPHGGLRRGSSVVLNGVASSSLALALVAEASARGSWVAIVGLDRLCLATADEFGIELSRVALIDEPGSQWAVVMSALVGAIDVIVAATPSSMRAADGRRLAARSRERGSVIVEVQRGRRSAMQGDVVLSVERQRWEGLQRGHGHLRQRRVVIEVSGRGAASRPRRGDLLLPGPSGRPESVEGVPGDDAGHLPTTYDTVADVADLTARLAEKIAARSAG